MYMNVMNAVRAIVNQNYSISRGMRSTVAGSSAWQPPHFTLFPHSNNLTLTEASLGSRNIQQLIFDSTVLNLCIGCCHVLEYWSTSCVPLFLMGLILQCCARTYQIMHRSKGVSLILVRDMRCDAVNAFWFYGFEHVEHKLFRREM